MRQGTVIAVTFALLCLLSFSSTAQDADAAKVRKARLEKEIQDIDRRLDANRQKSRNAQSRLTLLQKKIRNRKELVARSESEIKEYSIQMDDIRAQVELLSAREDSLSSRYAILVRSAYKNRDPKLWYMYILASEDISQAFRRYAYLKKISVSLREQALQIKQNREQLQQRQAELVELVEKAKLARDRRSRDIETLRAEQKESTSLVDRLKKDNARFEKELLEKKRQVNALNREIQKMLSSASGTSSKIDVALSDEFSKNRGKLPWPVDGLVTEPFGENNHPVFKNVKLPFNYGVGISTDPSAKVKAVFSGVVKQIVVMPGYNQCVLIQHGEYFSFYCKLASCSVKAGDKIKTGQTVGTVETVDGESQLHFQIWQGQSPLNPELWLR